MKITFRNVKPLKARTIFFAMACLALLAIGLAGRLMTNDLSAALDRATFSEPGWQTVQR